MLFERINNSPDELMTKLTIMSGSSEEKSGMKIALYNAREGDLAILLENDDVLALQKWFNNLNPPGSSEIFTMTDIANMLNEKLSNVKWAIQNYGINPVKRIAKIGLYSNDQFEQIKEALNE